MEEQDRNNNDYNENGYNTQEPENKVPMDIQLFSMKAILITTVLAGPLAAGIMMQRNFKNMNREASGKQAVSVGIVLTLVVGFGIIMLPFEVIEKIPSFFVPLIYTLIVYLYCNMVQAPLLTAHEKQGGRFYSAGKAVLPGIVSLVVLIGIMIIGAF